MAIKAAKIFDDRKVLVALSIPPLFGSYIIENFEKNRDKAEEYYKFFMDAAS